MPAPANNPTITLTMTMEDFGKLQVIMQRGRFDKVADMIFGFRAQVNEQIARLQQQPNVTGPRLVEETKEDTA
jgi:hypothetical protein